MTGTCGKSQRASGGQVVNCNERVLGRGNVAGGGDPEADCDSMMLLCMDLKQSSREKERESN